MAEKLSHPAAKPGLFTRYRMVVVGTLVLLSVVLLAFLLLKPAAVPDLAHGNAAGIKALAAGWAKGDMIVLVRHVERCDHSTAPCLSSADGITERARAVAAEVGAQYQHLGLDKTDIYNSPLTRAVQTSTYMFGKAGSDDGWLINCKGTMLRDVMAHKVAGRNLILVTHSECMAQLESELKLSASTLGYGASLFLSSDTANARPKVLGFIDAGDWRSVAFDNR